MKVMILNPPSKYSRNVVRDLFYGCWCKGKRIASAEFPPTSLLYVASVLENERHEIALLDAQAKGKNLEDVKRGVSKEQPEIIIIPTSTMSFIEDAMTLKDLKDISGAITTAFGSHVTFQPEESLQHEGIDYIVMREPEYIISDFVNAYEEGEDYKKVKGIGYRENGRTVINPPYPFIENLDDMPFPNREYISDFVYFNPLVKKLPWTTALTSRGCPGKCNFCSSPSFYGKKLRMRSPENVVDEMERIKEKGYNEIFYRDETFTASRKRTLEICNLICERNLDVSWIANARIGTVNKEIMRAMKEAGCHLIKFGVESGVQRILDNINKGIEVEMTRKTFKWANEIGMETHAHVMLGCIGETKETVEKTIEFAKEINPTTVTFGAFTPYPGTEVFEMVKERVPEIIDGSACDLSKLHTSGFYNYVFGDLTDEEIGTAVRRAYKKFYLRPSYIIKRLLMIRSLDEFRRVVSAGFNILSFSTGED